MGRVFPLEITGSSFLCYKKADSELMKKILLEVQEATIEENNMVILQTFPNHVPKIREYTQRKKVGQKLVKGKILVN